MVWEEARRTDRVILLDLDRQAVKTLHYSCNEMQEG